MNIQVIRADITQVDIEAIVNAANSSLLGGGGVDGAIHRAGGPEILEACRVIRAKQGKCKTGEAVITTGGKLKAKYVIHTVGPVWTGNKPDHHGELLRQCYSNSLQLAEQNGINSIAFPNISTGIYKFPKQAAAQIAIKAVKDFLDHSSVIDLVIFVCHDETNFKIYENIITQYTL